MPFISRAIATDVTLRAMHLYPAIDLRGGRVVRLTQGNYDQQTTYAADPLDQALAFEAAGATWLHLVDLDGARDGTSRDFDTIKRVCKGTTLKVQVGGGVRDERAVATLLDAGAKRVVLGTAALRDWRWFETLLSDDVYHHRITLGLDARDGLLAVEGWTETTGREAVEVAKLTRGWPLGSIVFTDIAVDGTLQGPAIEATRAVAEATDVGVIASGGVGCVDDLVALRKLPLAGVIVGKAIYEEKLSAEQALWTVEGSAAERGVS